MDVYSIPGLDDLQRHKFNRLCYTSEYLFYGPLRNHINDLCYKSVRWEHICGADYHDSLNTFSQWSPTERMLNKRVNELRVNYDVGTACAWPAHILPTVLLVSALFGNEFQTIIVIALITLLCAHRAPTAADLARDLSSFKLHRPLDTKSVVQFDFKRHIDAGLTEVIRMYQSLTEVLMLSLDEERRSQELAEVTDNLSIQE